MTRKIARKLVGVAPEADALLTVEQVGERWQVHPEVARRLLRRAGATFTRLTSKLVRIRLSQVLEIEHQAELSLPHGYRHDFPGRLEREAKKAAEVTK